MNNSFNRSDRDSTTPNLPEDYREQDFDPNESVVVNKSSTIEVSYNTSYLIANRNSHTESVTFLINIDMNQESEEIGKLNSIIEDEPIMEFLSSKA